MSPPATGDGARPRPIVLVVLDGFGIGPDPAVDAIRAADMPVWRGLLERWPNAVLRASEDAVGLPPGQMGNSEVGHLNLGAGKPVLQDLPRIDAAIADGSFNERPALLEACRRAAGDDGRLHIVSLIGPGGVHANDRHLVALVGLAAREGVRHVRIHALLDGRDTPPSSALGFVADLERRLAATHPDARIASVGGRYWAMDRDTRWERTERGYDAIVHGEGRHAPSAVAAIEEAYARGETDEFVEPTVIDGVDGLVRDGDPIVHANFRADRARQLTRALALPDFDGFDRTSPSGRPAPAVPFVVTMTAYEEGLPVEVAFPPEAARSLAQAFAEAGWTQFHVAETEKYAHVTYFFNGGVETPYPGEERLLVPSPQGRHVRPPAGDERARRDRRAGRRDRLGPLRLHRRELREPGHGRAHRRLGRDHRRARDDRRLPGPDRRGGGGRATATGRPRRGRCWRSPRITATPSTCGTARETLSPRIRSTRCRSSSSVGRLPASSCTTGCSRTLRQRCSRSPACRAGRG